MAVDRHVHTHYKSREVNKHALHVFVPNKPVVTLAVMGAETVKWVAERRDVENGTDQDIVSVEVNHNEAPSQSWCK